MDMIKAVAACLTGSDPEASSRAISSTAPNSDTILRAKNVVTTLLVTEKSGRDLRYTLDAIVGEYGWTENLAAAVLGGIENALRNGAPMGQAMKKAFDRASEEALGFVKEHPIFCTVIALGILVMLAPWVLEALGFAELGPLEGSFAAAWQGRYLGYVPKGSLFSYFQRLGMVWK